MVIRSRFATDVHASESPIWFGVIESMASIRRSHYLLLAISGGLAYLGMTTTQDALPYRDLKEELRTISDLVEATHNHLTFLEHCQEDDVIEWRVQLEARGFDGRELEARAMRKAVRVESGVEYLTGENTIGEIWESVMGLSVAIKRITGLAPNNPDSLRHLQQPPKPGLKRTINDLDVHWGRESEGVVPADVQVRVEEARDASEVWHYDLMFTVSKDTVLVIVDLESKCPTIAGEMANLRDQRLDHANAWVETKIAEEIGKDGSAPTLEWLHIRREHYVQCLLALQASLAALLCLQVREVARIRRQVNVSGIVPNWIGALPGVLGICVAILTLPIAVGIPAWATIHKFGLLSGSAGTAVAMVHFGLGVLTVKSARRLLDASEHQPSREVSPNFSRG